MKIIQWVFGIAVAIGLFVFFSWASGEILQAIFIDFDAWLQDDPAWELFKYGIAGLMYVGFLKGAYELYCKYFSSN